MRDDFDLSEDELDAALDASHVRYLSKVDTTLGSL